MALRAGGERTHLGAVAILALTVSLSLSTAVRAQVVGATLTGTVTDPSGAVIPIATVSIKNTETGVTRDVVTDGSGLYSAPNLIPGSYDVTTTAPGFATQIRSGITLAVGQRQLLNITLQVGETTQSVLVTGEAPLVQLESSDISAQINATTIRELPLNGRDWSSLAGLQPGVSVLQGNQVDFTQGSNRGTRGFATQMTISGTRPQENNFRLDGVSINDYSNGGPGSVLGQNLGVDAIQEFSVISSNYSAEYGRSSGGVVNAVTRSGTNSFHGAAYEFLRNSALDARNFFDRAKPPFRRNQFGADAGGPIVKNKVFIFGDYETIRQYKGITTINTVPSVAAASGHLCSAADTSPACTPTTISVDPSVQTFLPFWPAPNGGIVSGTNGDIGIFQYVAARTVTENFGTARIDAKLSNKDSLAGTYLGDSNPYSFPTALNAILRYSQTFRQVATLEETHSFRSGVVNNARVGYSRDSVQNNSGLTAINPLANDLSLSSVPAEGAAQVQVPGLTQFAGGVVGSGASVIHWNSYQAYDDAFWTHGAHSFKFGGAVEEMGISITSTINLAGLFSFASLKNFLLNIPSRYSGSNVTPPPTASTLSQGLYGVYAQDDWRVRRNLTLNMGLRWEMVTVPTETKGRVADLANLTDATLTIGEPWVKNATLHDFDPRVGFAWDPFGHGKSSVRGGFGVFEILPLLYQYYQCNNANGPPFRPQFGGTLAPPPPGSFYAGVTSLVTPSKIVHPGTCWMDKNTKHSYDMQWNLNVQHELGGGVTVTIGYVGQRGVHLFYRADNVNIVLPTKTPYGYLWPNPIGSGTLLNTNFASGMRGSFYGEDAYYNGLLTGVQKRFGHGFQFQTSFTWNKGIDSGSSTVTGDTYQNSLASILWTDIKSRRGPSDFNIGRTLVVNGTWAVPSVKSLSGPAAWITKGWQLGAIYKANDGEPFTPTFGVGGDPLGVGNTDPFDFPNRLSGPDCNSLINPGNVRNYIKLQCFALPTAPNIAFWQANCDPRFGTLQNLVCFNLQGNAGRNILTGPGLSNLDFSVFKNNPVRRISEGFNVQFRAEFFNILNHPNFAFPVTVGNPNNTNVFDAAGSVQAVAGILSATTTDSREIQFAVKVAW